MNPTNELDKFIRRIQTRSRITIDGKIIRMEPVCEKIKFDVTPTKGTYESCCGVKDSICSTPSCRKIMQS